ncbi:hypothetical protein JRO89_XS04G0060400 [Xanthoceras sorbifolium]|uniref:Uncharacterized protein n=1 Tax=Xanthoceras sorbifolium TaxID=99658 RepID=A0ABQ8I4B3_9ROSI|nr:hypothetical protein JRO89_XS04G0060400 [Xanthoceras sorbifolium]
MKCPRVKEIHIKKIICNLVTQMMEKTGKELSPIECFKKFHVRKHSTEVWTHEKAKQLYVCITLQIWVKAKDVYDSSSDESSKCARVDKQEELKLKIKSLTEELQEL